MKSARFSGFGSSFRIYRTLHKTSIMVLFVVAFFVSANFVWLQLDKAPPMWDQSQYLENSEILYHTLVKNGIVSFVSTFSSILQIKAPLITVLPIPLYILLGNTYTSALYVNLFFIAIGGYYLFKLGTIISGEKEALLSIFILNTFPLVFAMSREFLVEYGLMTFVIMWMYYLLKSNDFEDRRAACALGIILGLGMLMKISFPLYVLPPTIFLFIRKLVERRRIGKTSVKNIGILLLVSILIAGTWYFENLPSIIRFAVTSGFGETAKNWGMGDVFSLQTVLAYWTYIVNYGISAYSFFLIIFLFIMNFLVRKKNKALTGGGSGTYFLLFWFAVPFAVFTFGVNKDYRYTAPLWPAIAIWMSIVLIRISKIQYGRVLLFILLIFPLLNYSYVSFSPKAVFLKAGGLELLNNNLAYAHPPREEPWPNKELVTLMHNDSSRTDIARPRTTLLFGHHYLNSINLNYYSNSCGLNTVFDTTDHLSKETPEETAARIERDSDYILTKSDDLGPDFANAKNVQVISLLMKGQLNFKEIGAIPLPDNTRLTIYKNKKSAHAAHPDIDETKRKYRIDTNNSINFSNRIKLLDHKIARTDGGYRLILFWECLDIIERDYKVFVHIEDRDDNPISNVDHYPGNIKYPTYDWKKGEIIRDEVDIPAPLPEKFRIYVGIYEESSMSRLLVNNRTADDPVNINGIRIH